MLRATKLIASLLLLLLLVPNAGCGGAFRGESGSAADGGEAGFGGGMSVEGMSVGGTGVGGTGVAAPGTGAFRGESGSATDGGVAGFGGGVGFGGTGVGGMTVGGMTVGGAGGGVLARLAVKQLATGPTSQHVCAALNDGTARCWGDNSAGQLGDRTKVSSQAPILVLDGSGSPLTGILSLATGTRHTCAVSAAGMVLCWGNNDYGQLGNGTTSASPIPVAVTTESGAPLSAVSAISAGDRFTCALRREGTVFCWGSDEVGQLAHPPQYSAPPSPVAVAVENSTGEPISGATAISAGASHTCAIVSGGAVTCWGYNIFGQLGNGTDRAALGVVSVVTADLIPIAGIVAVSAGVFTTCAAGPTAGVQCWGLGNGGVNGLLGARGAALVYAKFPVTIVNDSDSPLSGATDVSVAGSSACVRLGDATVQCWGNRESNAVLAPIPPSQPSLTWAIPRPVLSSSGGPLGSVISIVGGSTKTYVLLRFGTTVASWAPAATATIATLLP